jgi:hypothetical protein
MPEFIQQEALAILNTDALSFVDCQPKLTLEFYQVPLWKILVDGTEA